MMISLRCLLQLCYLPLLASGILLPPENLSFTSHNFKHILTWEEPNKKSAIFYNVEYEINYSGKFDPVINCSNITTRRCDLTKDFTGIFKWYRAQVWSFASTERSDPSPPSSVFRPFDTVAGPPIVDVVAAGSGIMVSISLPDSYLWDVTEQRFVSILTAYPSIDYEIYLEPSSEVPISIMAMSEESFNVTIPSLFPSTTYCVNVSMDSENMNSISSPKKCVTTNGSQAEDNDNVYWIIAGVALLITLLLILVVLDQAGYISKKTIFPPKVLASLPDSRILLQGPEKLSSLINLISPEMIHNLNNEHINEDPSRIMDSAPYIAHNRNAENAEAPNQDDGLSSNGPPTRECSTGLFLGLTQMVLSGGPSVQVMMPVGDNISTELPAVIPWPERTMEAPSEDAVDGTGNLLSTLTNGCDDSLNLSLRCNRISIDLSSVLFGDSVDHCTNVPMVASPKDSHGYPIGDAASISQFILLPSVLNGDIPTINNLNCENNEDGGSRNDLAHTSNYLRK